MSKKSEGPLYLPQLKFIAEIWENLSVKEKNFFLEQAAKKREIQFIKNFLHYHKDATYENADQDRAIFLDVATRQGILIDIIFSTEPRQFGVILADVLLQNVLKYKNKKALEKILTLHKGSLDKQYAQAEEGANPNGSDFKDSNHPNAIRAFIILADHDPRQLQNPDQIKLLWQQIDLPSQKILWLQSLNPNDVQQGANSNFSNEKLNRIHNILMAVKNSPIDENHPLNWIENIELKKAIWFQAITNNDFESIENIINFYRNQPIDENHPLNWRNQEGHNALCAILYNEDIDFRIVKKLLDAGSKISEYMRDENAVYDKLEDEQKYGYLNALKIIQQHQKKLAIEGQIISCEAQESSADIMETFVEKFEAAVSIFLKKSPKSKEAFRIDFATRLQEAYSKICEYSLDEQGKINPQKLSEALTGFLVDSEGNVKDVEVINASKKQAIIVMMTASDPNKPKYSKRETDAVANIVQSLISADNRNKVMATIAELGKSSAQGQSTSAAASASSTTSSVVVTRIFHQDLPTTTTKGAESLQLSGQGILQKTPKK